SYANAPAYPGLGEGDLLDFRGLRRAVLLGHLYPVELSLFLRRGTAGHGARHMDRKLAVDQYAGAGHHRATVPVDPRSALSTRLGRAHHRRDRLHARSDHSRVPAGAVILSRLASVPALVAALAAGLRPAGAVPAVRGRRRDPAHLVSVRSSPAALRQPSAVGGQHQLRLWTRR